VSLGFSLVSLGFSVVSLGFGVGISLGFGAVSLGFVLLWDFGICPTKGNERARLILADFSSSNHSSVISAAIPNSKSSK